jgi:ssDNA-binding Zn-finger/Zn-ribbon topoisomerase 1
MFGTISGAQDQLLNFGPVPASLGIVRLSVRKGDFHLEHFLICTNPACRFIVDLREGAQTLERSKLVINECPECGNSWSSYCPFCDRSLEVVQRGNLFFCSRCSRSLHAETA